MFWSGIGVAHKKVTPLGAGSGRRQELKSSLHHGREAQQASRLAMYGVYRQTALNARTQTGLRQSPKPAPVHHGCRLNYLEWITGYHMLLT